MGSCGSSASASPPRTLAEEEDFAKGQVPLNTPHVFAKDCDVRRVHSSSRPAKAPSAPGQLLRNDSFFTCYGDDGDVPADEEVFVPRRHSVPQGIVSPSAEDACSHHTGTQPRRRSALRRKSHLRSLPPGTGTGVPRDKRSKPKVMGKWDFTTDPKVVEFLRDGGSCYAFHCSPGTSVGAPEKRMIGAIINLSGFADETRENHVPCIDLCNTRDLADHIFMLNKACYVLPKPITTADLTAGILASTTYQKACQGDGTTVWADGDKGWERAANTFRITKTIIRFILSITVQFRCSDLPPAALPELSALIDGLQVHSAILLERTKRDPRQQDATKKVKSVLLMHQLDGGGVLVANVTCAAQASLPGVVARMVDKLGSLGAAEVADTCDRTRKYLLARAREREK
eukprot:TRINITY_DN65316_c0_g1_i1.p1 TRINITY_DN65316_c0_g1~~TRINITY_DN65316_c0_g1_i1.p1  ORF type:complete len:425 (+),score=103.89 TRINITY_DN65316_c0_g1_i1:74-1276(+)